jgi:D-aminopeptidase
MSHNRLYISADIEGMAGVVSREQTIPEGFYGISAATAHFNVPVIMVSGDDAYAEHARSVLDENSDFRRASATAQCI